jgi:hypothetical protein
MIKLFLLLLTLAGCTTTPKTICIGSDANPVSDKPALACRYKQVIR